MADFLAKLEEEEAKLGEANTLGSSFADDNVRAKIQLAHANSPALQSIDFKYANVSADNLKQLRRALKKNTHVTKIDLTGNSLRGDAFKAVCRLIMTTKHLACVDLRFCDIEKEMGPSLIDAIKGRGKEGLAPLEQIMLDGNFLSSADQASIGSMLTAPFLKTLSTASASSSTPRIGGGSTPRMNYSSSSSTEFSAGSDTEELIRQLQARLHAERRRADEAQREEARLRERVAKFEEDLAKRTAEEKKKHKDDAKKNKITITTKNLRILDRLYTSGSGAQIYSCLVDGWLCAMKELVVDPLVPDHVILSFETEIAIAERLPYHPNVIRYLFHEKSGDKLRLFMTKYNTALRAVLARHRGDGSREPDFFSAKEVTNIMLQIVMGLEFLHKNKVMHRDVKPDNILCLLDSVGDIDLVAITDFDSAKLLTKSTSAKTTVGTPAYMAPEVMSSSNKDPYSFKADVWSVGMVLYELMTLKMPYEEEDRAQLVGMIQEGRRPSVDKIPAAFAELIPIYTACTSQEPSDRPDLTVIREKLQQVDWNLKHSDD